MGSGGLGFEDEVFLGDAQADEIVGHGGGVATLFGGVFALDDGAVGGDDEFADDAFMIELDAFGEAVDIAAELRTVALPVPVTTATEDDAVFVGFAWFYRPGVAFTPFLGRYLKDGFYAEKEGGENGETGKGPLPPFVMTAEPSSYDKEEYVAYR